MLRLQIWRGGKHAVESRLKVGQLLVLGDGSRGTHQSGKQRCFGLDISPQPSAELASGAFQQFFADHRLDHARYLTAAQKCVQHDVAVGQREMPVLKAIAPLLRVSSDVDNSPSYMRFSGSSRIQGSVLHPMAVKPSQSVVLPSSCAAAHSAVDFPLSFLLSRQRSSVFRTTPGLRSRPK